MILGLNLKEAAQIAAVLGLEKYPNPESALENLAAEIRQKLNLFCVVVHPRRGAAAAISGQTAQFDGPFVVHPKISTGAGDHFNAGFCLAQTLGLNLEESLAAAVASSGYYVRTAQSATGQQLADFLATLPQPQHQ
jgi:sugar/nucleoside kinase (ribokinase family)